MHGFFDSIDMPSLPPGLRQTLEAPVSKAEIQVAIASMQSGKSPGPDGFSTDFYKKFLNDLAPFLCKVFTELLDSGAFPPSCYQACITVLLKKGKDPTVLLIGLYLC